MGRRSLIKRREFLTGAAALAAFSQVQEAEALMGGSRAVLGTARVYQGQVMTGCRWPLYLASPQTYFNSQSPHFAVDSGSRLKVVLLNSYASESTTSLGNITYTAAIWSATNATTLGSLLGQFTFGGSTSGVCAPGALLESDWLSLNYTKGTQYFIRLWGNSAGSGLPFFQVPAGGNSDTAHGAKYENSSSVLADKTTSGAALSVLSATYSFCPIAVIGDTTLPSVLMVGDSITCQGAAGKGDNFDGTSPRVGFPDRVLGTFGTNGYAGINCGYPGEKASTFVSSHTVRAALQQYVSTVWSNYGINDINNNDSAATVYANLQSIAGLFTSKRFVQGYVGYEGTSTDSFATLVNQTVYPQWVPGTGTIDTLNSSIANFSRVSDHRSGCFDAATHKWLVDGTAFKYTPDGVHPGQFCSQNIASGGFIPASLFAR